MEIRFASIEDIIGLREAVIIAGTDRDTPYFLGDDEESTRHIGVFDEGRCIGCATFLRAEWHGRPAWRLRGMAVTPAKQKQGIGRALLQFAEEHLREEEGPTVFWCNARETAAEFYEKNGWSRASGLFQVEGVGPHYCMVRHV